VLETADTELVGQCHRMARALDIGQHLALRIGLEVVDRRQMEEVLDRSLELFQIGGLQAQPWLGEVADARNRALFIDAPVLEQVGNLVPALLSHQEVHHCAAPLEQLLHQSLADEAARPRDEITHGPPPPLALN